VIGEGCREFKCLPWQMQEQLEHDREIVYDILELRSFVNTHHAIKNAKDESDVPKGEMTKLWAAIDLELMAEERSE
jgi:hypothetical protein